MFKFKVIIPARKGSKRLIKKNLKKLSGIPLIEYSINYALRQNEVEAEDIWINTDCNDIAKIGRKHNCNIHMRPKELGSDYATTVEVIKEQLEFFNKNQIKLDYVIILQPTNPLRPKNLLSLALNILKTSEISSLATFSTLNKKYGKIVNDKFIPTNYKPGQRTQDIDSDYYENGLLYISSVKSILSGKIISDDTYPLVVNHIYSKVDVDTLEDFIFAQNLLNQKHEPLHTNL